MSDYAHPEVLVTTDWVRPTSANPASAWSRWTWTPRRTTPATSPAPSDSTGRPSSRTSSPATSFRRRRSKRCCRRAGISQRRHRRPVRRQQQLVRRLRLLAVQDVRPRGCPPDERRSREVAEREGQAAHSARKPPARLRATGRPRPNAHSAGSRGRRARSLRAPGAPNFVDVRSPDEFTRQGDRASRDDRDGPARRAHPRRQERAVERRR